MPELKCCLGTWRNLWILYIRYNKLVNYTSGVVIRNRRKIHQGITGTTRYYRKNLTRGVAWGHVAEETCGRGDVWQRRRVAEETHAGGGRGERRDQCQLPCVDVDRQLPPVGGIGIVFIVTNCDAMSQFCLTSFAHGKSLSTPFENCFDDKLRQIKSVLAYCGYI